VQGDLVDVSLVDSLDDVDLSSTRPATTDSPEGGPRSTDRSGHVVEIDDEKTLSERLLRLETNGGTSIGCLVGVIDSHVNLISLDGDQAALLSGGSVFELYVSMSGITGGPEIELIVKIVTRPFLLLTPSTLGPRG